MSPSATPTLLDAWPAIALLAVILALPWMVKWLRQSGWKVLKPAHSPVSLVSALAVGPQQRVVVVVVTRDGSAPRWLILGVTPQSISRLDVIEPDGEGAAPVASPVSPPPAFADRLAEHLDGDRS
jgi:flagellar protein FliO/FliZ